MTVKRMLKTVCVLALALGSADAVRAEVPFRLGVAGFTFARMSLDASIAAMQASHCRWLAINDAHITYSAGEAEISAYLAKLGAAGIRTEVVGPVYFDNERTIRTVFEFARRCGARTVTGIPYEAPAGKADALKNRVESEAMLDVVERLVKAYDIRFAIHSHGPDMKAPYPTAESVMARIGARDRRIGLCLDVRRERRMGIDPVKTIEKYGDRIYDIHINNILIRQPEKGVKPYLPTTGANGNLDVPAIFHALAKVGYRGICHIEHVGKPTTANQMLAESAGYFRGVMDSIREPRPVWVAPLLKTRAGVPVKSAAQWEKTRRPELLEFFRANVYGRRPVQRPANLAFEQIGEDVPVLGGKAVRRRVRITWPAPRGTGAFTATAFLPKNRASPAPVFLYLNLVMKKFALDYALGRVHEFWPAQDILARGFATAVLEVGEIAPDQQIADWGHEGVPGLYLDRPVRAGDDWGALSAWGWGASRVLDWLETQREADATHVAVVGHSRGGKTAMWCACEDPRFAMACINNSGCGGAKFNHIELSGAEPLGVGASWCNSWYCRNYSKYAGFDLNARMAPYDQHQALALIAPRLVCVASAANDPWAGPYGEYWTARLASPAWALYGRKGLVTDGFPAAGTAQQEGCISYHLRIGPHGLTRQDWARYLDFAVRHGWR